MLSKNCDPGTCPTSLFLGWKFTLNDKIIQKLSIKIPIVLRIKLYYMVKTPILEKQSSAEKISAIWSGY